MALDRAAGQGLLHSLRSPHLPAGEKAAILVRNAARVEQLQELQIPVHPDVLEKIVPITSKNANPVNMQFPVNATYMLEYTHLTPAHPYYTGPADILGRIL